MHIFDESYDNGEKKKKYTQKEQQRITSPTLQQQIASVLRYAIDNAVKVFQGYINTGKAFLKILRVPLAPKYSKISYGIMDTVSMINQNLKYFFVTIIMKEKQSFISNFDVSF